MDDAALTKHAAERAGDVLRLFDNVLASRTAGLAQKNDDLKRRLKLAKLDLGHTERKRLKADDARQQAEDASCTDALTGLLNRRGWDKHLENLFHVAQRMNTEDGLKQVVIVMAFDLDNFKLINDNPNYGHDVGDAVLKAFAKHMAVPLNRSLDVAARTGGDEFATAWLCGEDVAYGVAEKLGEITRAEIEENCRINPKGKVSDLGNHAVTASIGITFMVPGYKDDVGAEIDAVKKRADKAAYAAKMAGRNRAYVFKNDGSIAPSNFNPPERLIIEEPDVTGASRPGSQSVPGNPAPLAAPLAGVG